MISGVRRFFTPLLIRWYGVLMGVCLADGGLWLWRHSEWHKEALYRRMVSVPGRASFESAETLVELSAEKQLVRGLRERSPRVRRLAIGGLWDLWYHAAGEDAFEQARLTVAAMESREYDLALRIANRMVARYPRFAEGWNRRATVLWQMGRFNESIHDCRKALALEPDHFGAWEGLGLCQVQLGDFRRAILAFRSAARIQPFDAPTRALLDQCLEYRRTHPEKGGKPSDREI